MTKQTKTMIESDEFIILNEYKLKPKDEESYQSEDALEKEFIEDLQKQGYEFCKDIKDAKSMLANVRTQLQKLNNVQFTDAEWKRFLSEYLDPPNENMTDKARKIHDKIAAHDFVFDDGNIKNIHILDKKNIVENKLQVIKQFENTGLYANRYDVTLLVNGLPLIHIELKKRGVPIKEAFNQIHRYSKESFNSENSLYKYIQIFVISNGTDSRYFANTTKRNKNSFDFSMPWATKDNRPIHDLKDLTATFFEQKTILSVLIKYSILDASDTLLIMRPYQIAATERILWKINSSYQQKSWNKPESGGYIWHTTGSGKTLTSFKAAQLTTHLDFIDKVLFVVDRKDLDFQTMKEYQRFSPDSVNGSNNTAGLKKNLAKDDNKIIVTTIQKLNTLVSKEKNLDVYKKNVVLIFDECHRSQFGEAQRNIKKKFKSFLQFGFTGTPIFQKDENSFQTTANVFGANLHAYVITHAISDGKVLKFKVDYNDVRPQFSEMEKEANEETTSSEQYKEKMRSPKRIEEIAKYILQKYPQKTHRLTLKEKGFNAMFAVDSVEAAKKYYEAFEVLQKDIQEPLKITTIYSYAPNQEQQGISDESFDVDAMNSSNKEFLQKVINDYNKMFSSNFKLSSDSFQNYYRDVSLRMKQQEIDLLIVVGMFLTGFDAPKLNTLFIDKNVREHGLIQAYSRTNRIYDKTKSFGNVVTFRDLEAVTIEAIQKFGDHENADKTITVLEKKFSEHLEEYIKAVNIIKTNFENHLDIVEEQDKKEFVKAFGEYLHIENILQNYDEFNTLKALQHIDINDEKALEDFKNTHYISDEKIEELKKIDVLPDRMVQDYRSTYYDIKDWLQKEKANDKKKSTVNWDDVVWEVELLKSQEINLDYILEQIFNKNKEIKDKDKIIEYAQGIIRSSIGNRAKEKLIIDFIKYENLDAIKNKAHILEEFYTFAQGRKKIEIQELIEKEKLNVEAARNYIQESLKKGYASDNGNDLNDTLPKVSPLNPQYLSKKQSVFKKIFAYVEKFKGIGGEL